MIAGLTVSAILAILAITFASIVRGICKLAFLVAGAALLYPVVAHFVSR